MCGVERGRCAAPLPEAVRLPVRGLRPSRELARSSVFRGWNRGLWLAPDGTPPPLPAWWLGFRRRPCPGCGAVRERFRHGGGNNRTAEPTRLKSRVPPPRPGLTFGLPCEGLQAL